MNLVEALDVALPDLPSKRALKSYPRIHPKLISREHMEEGAPVVVTHIPGTSELYRFSRDQWALVQLFDGRRSYAEVSHAFQTQSGLELPEADLRSFAETLQEGGFWYRSPQERYESESRAEKKRSQPRKKSRFADLSRIHFSAWDPDAFLTRIYPYTRFLFSGWFTLLTLALFAFMVYVFVDHWAQIGGDTLRYYTFTDKGVGDLAEFWLLFFFLGFFHESAHGLTCKHYGGGVHHMGFQLLYLTPTFFVEVTEGWVYANRWQRLPIIIAGIWVELIFCAAATIVWWGTAPGVYIHELAYKVMLITGVAVVIVNLNPLIKLDGYFFFCELLGIADIKEHSTGFVTGWIKKNFFRLPADLEFVTWRRRILYVSYAVLSGAYSYLLLLAVARFAYNVMRAYSPEWAFLPALYLVYLMFRSRLKSLGVFMRTLYLDKKERFHLSWRQPRVLVAGAVLAFLLLVPLWRQSAQGRFILEPSHRQVLRAEVAGRIVSLNVREDEDVTAGATLGQLGNLTLESQVAKAQADAESATGQAIRERLNYSHYAEAEHERQRAEQERQVLQEQASKLQIVSPMSGTVVTPHADDLAGSYVRPGDTILEIADLANLTARIFVPESDLRYVAAGAEAKLRVDGSFRSNHGSVVSILPASTDIEPGLVELAQYKGIRPPAYYPVLITLDNENRILRQGMSGTAIIYSSRRSVGAMALEVVRDFVGRKLW
jgi:putative peptide zinc metalloprotease protein